MYSSVLEQASTKATAPSASFGRWSFHTIFRKRRSAGKASNLQAMRFSRDRWNTRVPVNGGEVEGPRGMSMYTLIDIIGAMHDIQGFEVGK